jgi:hypothetical protein
LENLAEAGMQPEILMLLAMKLAHEQFIEEQCFRISPSPAGSRRSKKEASVFLRDHQDKIARIAEFFFLMRAVAPLTAERAEKVARGHNLRLQRKIEGAESPSMSAKLQKGLFSPSAIRMLGVNNASGATSINLSQSDLARFFCETMSDELMRNLITVLVDAGILISAPAWYNAKIISSPGILEDCYQQYLSRLADSALSNTTGHSDSAWTEGLATLSADPVFSIVSSLLTHQTTDREAKP